MNKKKIVKTTLIFGSILIGIFLIGVFLMVAFSPFGYDREHDFNLLQESVVINAPVEQVYSYLGDSDNAREWSVYVDHITTVNSDQIPDGEQGSVRQCFVNANENGKKWDEKVLLVEFNKRRRLSCYNYEEFENTVGTLYTEQVYEETKDGKCLLSFNLFFPAGESTLWKRMKMYYAAYEVARIFKKNLKNIQKYNERRKK